MIEIPALDSIELVAFRLRKFAGSVVGTRIHNQNLVGWESLNTQPLTQARPLTSSIASRDDHANPRPIKPLIDGEARSKSRRHGRDSFQTRLQVETSHDS
jgi:hypothetical protein